MIRSGRERRIRRLSRSRSLLGMPWNSIIYRKLTNIFMQEYSRRSRRYKIKGPFSILPELYRFNSPSEPHEQTAPCNDRKTGKETLDARAGEDQGDEGRCLKESQ